MTAFDWVTLRERAFELFAETPSPSLEAEILGTFQTRPALVATTIEGVGREVAAGRVRSGWAILGARLRNASEAPSVVAFDTGDRERRVARASRWIETAGVHFDRETELLDELFDGYGGDRELPLLHTWRDEQELREEMLKLWRDLRRRVAAA